MDAVILLYLIERGMKALSFIHRQFDETNVKVINNQRDD